MNEPQRTRAYCGVISGYSCLGPMVRSYLDVPTARLRRKDRRICAHLGVLPDDLYIQSEPWPPSHRPAAEARCNPRKPAYCEMGRPNLRRASGLAAALWFGRLVS
jgi:hypothetical protein